jgi:hypothetical protein
MTERSTEEVLKSLSNCDELLDHDDNCGHCFRLWCMAEAARRLVAEKNYSMDEYIALDRKLWEDGKYFKLYQEEKTAGRDPHKAFEERQWEM